MLNWIVQNVRHLKECYRISRCKVGKEMMFCCRYFLISLFLIISHYVHFFIFLKFNLQVRLQISGYELPQAAGIQWTDQGKRAASWVGENSNLQIFIAFQICQILSESTLLFSGHLGFIPVPCHVPLLQGGIREANENSPQDLCEVKAFGLSCP